MTVGGDFSPLYLGCFRGFRGVCSGVLGCFRVFQGGLDYVKAKNMMVRPFLGAISGPILGKNSVKSQLEVIFRPCTLAVLEVFGGYWGVF